MPQAHAGFPPHGMHAEARPHVPCVLRIGMCMCLPWCMVHRHAPCHHPATVDSDIALTLEVDGSEHILRAALGDMLRELLGRQPRKHEVRGMLKPRRRRRVPCRPGREAGSQGGTRFLVLEGHFRCT